MKVDELIALGGAAPPIPSSDPSSTVVDEITKIYFEIYAPGLTHFFETRWFDLRKEHLPAPESNSLLVLHQNRAAMNIFVSFLQNIIDIKSTDPVDMVHSSHLETHVVWALASLPLSCLPTGSPARSAAPPDDDLQETSNRIHVFETLLSGGVLDNNPLRSPTLGMSGGGTGSGDPARKHEFEFWYHLGQYLLSSHSSTSTDDCSARDQCLSQLRSLLDGQENRDVLYSIAVMREYTLHGSTIMNEQAVSSQLDGSEPGTKLAVATRFIWNEANTEATTNVVRQFARLAYRAFVRPGVNAKSGSRKLQ